MDSDGCSEDELGPYVEQVMKDFEDYLFNEAIVYREQQAKGKADIVRRILRGCGVVNDFELFFDKDCRTLRITYLQDYRCEHDIKANTLEVYLRELKGFTKFIIKSNEVKNYIIENVLIKNVENMKTKIKLLRKLLRRECNERFHEHQEEDGEVLLEQGDGRLYRETERAQEAESLLTFWSNNSLDGHTIGRDDFVKVRDHLMCLVLFSNACRSGVLQNMTYADLSKATDHYGDNTKQISVWRHKTTSSYGSAIITIDTFICDWLDLFFRCIRPFAVNAIDNKDTGTDSSKHTRQPTVDEEYIFVKWGGRPFNESNDLSARVDAQFKKCGLHETREGQKRYTASIVRKSFVTGTRPNNRVDREASARVMMHSMKTQEQHYAIVDKKDMCRKGSKQVRTYYFQDCSQEIVGASTSNAVSSQQISTDSHSSCPPSNPPGRMISTHATPPRDEVASNHQTPPRTLGSPANVALQRTNSPISPLLDVTKRRRWSPKEISILRNVQGTPKRSSTNSISGLDKTPRQLYDRQLYEEKKQRRDEEKKQRRDEEKKQKKKKKKKSRSSKWPDEELMELRTHGAYLINGDLPFHRNFEEVLKDTAIFRKYTERQIRVRVDYEKLKTSEKCEGAVSEEEEEVW